MYRDICWRHGDKKDLRIGRHGFACLRDDDMCLFMCDASNKSNEAFIYAMYMT